jgi:phosphatidylcholine synthase
MTVPPHVDLDARPSSLPGRPGLAQGKLAGIAAHLFTALGAGLGFLAIAEAADRRFGLCFAWLGVAFVVDGLDGALARRLRVGEIAPDIDGALLDLVVDYLTYVIAPLFAVWMAQASADAGVILPCAALAAVGSALYFADTRMKTSDHWFRGFPACWNVLALYYFAFHPPLWATAFVLIGATMLLFAPFASVHPLRTKRLRPLTVFVSCVWLACAGVLVWRDFHPQVLAQWGLMLTAIYFIALSLFRGSADRHDHGGPG